jgi:hypothetical protein
VIAARRALMALADRLVPAHVALFDRSVGMARTHVIGTLAELGVADELSRSPATAEELAGRLNVNADALHRVIPHPHFGTIMGDLSSRRGHVLGTDKVGDDRTLGEKAIWKDYLPAG